MNTGIYWMELATGESHFVRKTGSDARFSPDGARIFFMEGGGLNKTYKSVRPDGGDERSHFTLKYPTDVVPSPDGKWVAFAEAFNVYVAPFPQTGDVVSLSKDTRAIPVSRLSANAGTDLHWSAGSDAVHWMLGPEYFSRSLSDAFSFLNEGNQALPGLDSSGVSVGLRVPSDAPEGRIAFTGGRIITMEGDTILEEGTLVVDGNRILAVGSDVTIPEDAEVYDISGKTIIPGLIDAHAHALHFSSGTHPTTKLGLFCQPGLWCHHHA